MRLHALHPAAVGAAAALLVLGACTGSPAGSPTSGIPSATSAPEPSAAPTTTPPATQSVTTPAGRILDVALTGGGDLDLEPDAPRFDGGVDVTATLTAPDSTLAITLVDATPEVMADRSVLLRSADGSGGLTTPQATAAHGGRARVVTDVVGSSVVITPRTRADDGATFPVEVTLSFAPTAIERVEWADDVEGGRSLQVFPTPWGRSASLAAGAAAWDGVVMLEPDADTDVMNKQLRCHVLGAPDKESWNLEPWRPDVGYTQYLLARCNPVAD